jgi:alpha-tubulin suppressor-like RCC1 family protein
MKINRYDWGDKQMNNRIHRIIMRRIAGLLVVGMVFALWNLSAVWSNPIGTIQVSPVSVGTSHALIIDSEGNVWAYGNNKYGQLGDGSVLPKDNPTKIYSYNSHNWSGKAVAVAAGLQQSLMLLENGTVLQWGFSNLSEPIQKPIALQEKATAIAAGQDICMAILESGKAVLWSQGMPQRIIQHPLGGNLTNVRGISVGSNDFVILRDLLGRVYQVNTTDYRSTFLIYRETTSTSMFGIFSESIVESSSSEESQASEPPSEPESSQSEPESSQSEPESSQSEPESSQPEVTPTPTLTPVPQDVLLTSVATISAGENFAVALLKNGDVYTWGNPARGALGYQASSVVIKARKVNLSDEIRKISAGFRHTIVQTKDGKWIGWGDAADLMRLDHEKRGIILPPSQLNLAFGAVTYFVCGDSFNIAITEQGEYYAWGDRNPSNKIKLEEYLLKVSEPSVGASMIDKDAITVTWDPKEYFTELARGFMVSYSQLDGTEGRTQLLPPTTSSITIRGLQFATNYAIVLSIHGKTGYVESLQPFVVQTLREDQSAIESEVSREDLTPSPPVSSIDENSVDSANSSDSDPNGNILPTSVIGIVLIIISLLILFAAIFAIIFVWRRLDREDKPRFKAKRINITDLPADTYDEELYEGDAEYKEQSETIEEIEEIEEVGEAEEAATDQLGNTETNEGIKEYDDDDDFIVRKP